MPHKQSLAPPVLAYRHTKQSLARHTNTKFSATLLAYRHVTQTQSLAPLVHLIATQTQSLAPLLWCILLEQIVCHKRLTYDIFAFVGSFKLCPTIKSFKTSESSTNTLEKHIVFVTVIIYVIGPA